jgi:FtsP/CotA-like multicopper oxidase with cupredoxin domain
MTLRRRLLLQLAAPAALAAAASPAGSQPPPAPAAPEAAADYTLRIGVGLVELGHDTIISTKLYSNQFPGPLLRLTEGKPVVVDVHNDTNAPEQLHWHGMFLPGEIDGAAEEGTPFIPPHGMRRIALTPRPAGCRF